MSRFIDLTDATFGRLTVMKRVADHHYPSGGHDSMWECQCSCGQTCVVSGSNLRKGNTQSCGCLHRESVFKMGKDNTKHGDARHDIQNTETRLYTRWQSMRERCNNPKAKAYKHYGGRGIKICKEWEQYDVFKKWALENGYSDELSIDRIDVNGDYSPDNCRWADRETQANNKRNTIYITIGDQTRCLSDWAKTSGISPATLRDRLKRGIRGDALFNQGQS